MRNVVDLVNLFFKRLEDQNIFSSKGIAILTRDYLILGLKDKSVPSISVMDIGTSSYRALSYEFEMCGCMMDENYYYMPADGNALIILMYVAKNIQGKI